MSRADNRPPYSRIAGHYRDLIESEALPPGKLLPSIKAIAEEWGVSSGTVEKALRVLREEHLVKGVHGIGTEVLGPRVPLSTGTERHQRSSRTQSSWGDGETSSNHTGDVVAAPKEIANVLAIAPGSDVIRRCRTYRDAHGIVAHSTSWIPAEFGILIPALKRNERLKGGLSLDLIARATGRKVAVRVDEERAQLATEQDLELLGLEPETVAAILVLTASFLDADGQVLEHGVDLGAPGRTRRTTSEVL